MVGYQDWVSIVFEIAREKGATIDSLEDSQRVLEVAALLWSNNPALKGMSTSEAKSFARAEISRS